MKSEWSALRVTPDLLRCVGILSIRSLLDCKAFRTYLYVVNISQLLEEPTQYIQWTLLANMLIQLPVGFLFEHLYTLPPRLLLSAVYTVRAGAMFLYGLLLVSDDLASTTRIPFSFLCFLVADIAQGFEQSYYHSHILPELNRRYGTSLGVLNSFDKLCETVIESSLLVLVGYLYVCWDFHLSTFYLCTIFTLLSLTYAALSYSVVGRLIQPAPARKGNSKLKQALRGQFGALWTCPIRKLILANILLSFTIRGTYVTTFILSVGMDTETKANVEAFNKVIVILSTVINVLKYRLRDWMTTAKWIFLAWDAISLGASAIIAGGYMHERALPWLLGVEMEENSSMPGWMVGWVVYALSTSWLHQVCNLMYQEYFQIKVAPSARGAIQGIMVVLSLSLSLFLTLFNLLLSSELLYISNFVLTVTVHLVMVALVASYIADSYRGVGPGREITAGDPEAEALIQNEK